MGDDGKMIPQMVKEKDMNDDYSKERGKGRKKIKINYKQTTE